MALGRSRGSARGFDYWPGFVDALSTMLLALIFLLSVFMLAQFFLSRDISGKDTALARLNRQIEELTSLLALERAGKADAQSTLAALTATLDAQVTVHNEGERPAEDIRLDVRLLSASASQDDELGAIFAHPVAAPATAPATVSALML